jgi:prephenate dehydrogenase
MTWRRVTIVGLGLIGGSMGLALKRAATRGTLADLTVVGWDQHAETRELALARNVVDRAPGDLGRAVGDAEIVIVAVPVLGTRDVFAAIAPFLRPSTIVTDVASTKALVCGWAQELLPCPFVGGHPMAGSERGGVTNARDNLFDGATYCLTPDEDTSPATLETVSGLVEAVGARPRIMQPEAHDRAVAAISHLPFLLSTLLVELPAASPDWEEFRAIAATGFRDVSRLASGDPRMHHDICITNAAAIRPWLVATARALEGLADGLEDSPALLKRFEEAKAIRDEMIAGQPSASP